MQALATTVVMHSTQAWVVGTAHPAGGSQAPEIACSAVQPDSTTTAGFSWLYMISH